MMHGQKNIKLLLLSLNYQPNIYTNTTSSYAVYVRKVWSEAPIRKGSTWKT